MKDYERWEYFANKEISTHKINNNAKCLNELVREVVENEGKEFVKSFEYF